MRFVNYADRKAVAAALKPIYTAPNADGALVELEAFESTPYDTADNPTLRMRENTSTMKATYTNPDHVDT